VLADAALSRSNEFVSGSWYGHDEPRIFRVWFDLLPQPRDEHVDAALARVSAAASNGVTQIIARPNLARTVCQFP
jgi:hypothetical protein